MSKQVGAGIYAGIPYIVVEKDSKTFIGLSAGVAAKLTARGANMQLLDDIGDQDPDEVMATLLDSLSKK